MILNQNRFAFFVHPLIGVHPRTLHMPVRRRNSPGGEQKGNHVHSFRGMADEIELAFRILNIGYWIWFKGVYKIRKLDGIPYKKNLQIVAYQVPVALLGVHFHSKPDRKSTRLNSSHVKISYAVFCL